MNEMKSHEYKTHIKEQDLGEMGKALSINEKALILALQVHISNNKYPINLLPKTNDEAKDSCIEFVTPQGQRYQLDLQFKKVNNSEVQIVDKNSKATIFNGNYFDI